MHSLVSRRFPLCAAARVLLAGLAIILSALSVQAQIDYSDPTGSFTQAMVAEQVVSVSNVPKGVNGLTVHLTANAGKDIDIRLVDLDNSRTLIGYDANGVHIDLSPSAGDNGGPVTLTYGGMTVDYSGYAGTGGNQGDETITITGATSNNLQVQAYAYAPDTATVNWSFSSILVLVDSAAIANAAPADLVLSLSRDVTFTNATGFSVLVGGESRAISSISGSGSSSVTLTLSSPVAAGEIVTFSYSTATGNMTTASPGEVTNFTNQAVTNNVAAVAPTVSTSAATGVDATSATVGGTVNSSGGASVTARGVVWSSSDAAPSIGGPDVTNVSIGTGTGAFSQSITGLSVGTTIYFRAYATNSAGTSYGSVLSFVTATPAPAISSATYDGSAGLLSVTAEFLTTGDTIDVHKLTLLGQGGGSRTLTTSNVTASSATAFSITLNAADRSAVNQLLNKLGTSSVDGTTYSLSAADDWNASVTDGDTADALNTVTVSTLDVAPSVIGLPVSLSFTEDTPDYLNLSASNFSDPDSTSITVTLAASAGTMGVAAPGGISVSLGGNGTGTLTIAGAHDQVNAYLNISSNIVYTPAAHANGSPAASLTVTANDGDGSGNVSLGSVALNVSAVNDAPSATNLTRSKNATEAGGAVALDDIVVTDPDSGETITATLTLSSTSAGSLSTGTYGSATSTYNAGTGVWTVTGSVADVNAALAAVALTPSANNEQNFTITTRIRDAANTGPADGTVTITVTPVNDAPSATNLTQSKAATEGGSAVALDDIVVTDVDSGETITATFTLSAPGAGTLSTGTYGSATSTFNAGSGVWTVTGSVADVNAALAAVALTPSANNDQNFTITTRIRDAANTGPADGTLTITVTAVNDAPSATNLTQSKAATEGGSAVALDDIVATDVDSGETITATLTLSISGAGTLSTGTYGSATSTFNAGTGVWTVTGSVADANAALAAVAFTPSANNDQNFTITTRIRDAANAGPADGTISFTVTAVNDTPTATNLTQSKTATEGGSAVALDDIVVTDVDSGETITATLTLSISGAGTLSTGTYGSATSTFNAGTGVWTVTGSVADVNAALAAVAFTPSANNDQNFTITTRIRDAVLMGPADGAISFTVTAENDAPVVTTSGGTTAYAEGNGTTAALAIDAALTVSDVDNTTLESASVSITANFISAEDLLAFENQNGISGSYDNGTGVLTLTGTSSLANYQAALRSVTYANTSDTPTTSNRTITFAVNDGNTSGAAATKAVSVTAVNDSPTIAGTVAAQAVTDKSTLTPFATVTVGDLDHASIAVTLSLDATAKGALSNLGDGSVDADTGVYTVTGSPAAVTSAIRGLVFTPTENRVVPGATETTTFTIEIEDAQAATATDAATTVVATSINDAPTDLALSGSNLSHSAGANGIVGTLSTTDADTGETFTYSLVAGTGATDNASFNISGNQLRATAPTGLAPGNHSVRVQTKDASDATFEEAFTIAVGDDVAATIQSISGPAAGTYGIGEAMDFTFVFSESVTVDTAGGIPVLRLTVGGVTKSAVYLSGSGSTTLLFRYIVEAGDQAGGGEVEAVELSLEGGTIKDASGNNASLAFTSATLTGVQVKAGFHSADTDRNWRLSLLELTRVIELYNTRDGTVRTGGYHSQSDTEDGFAPGTGAITSHHSADTNQDGKLSLLELTRVIELYNTRDGTVRTGEYHRSIEATEDGFAPGSAN